MKMKNNAGSHPPVDLVDNLSPQQVTKVILAVLGEYPEDVAGFANSTSDAFSWLEEIFITIRNEALVNNNGYRLKHLADAGAYIASEMGNSTGCWGESMMDRFRKSGMIEAVKN